MKKFFFFLIILIVIILMAGYLFRHIIIRAGAEYALRKVLPDYITLGEWKLNLTGRTLVARKLDILNAESFSRKNILEVPELSCKFKKAGPSILEMGFEITDLLLREPLFIIERAQDGRLNLLEMKKRLNIPAARNSRQRPAGTEASTPAAKPLRKPADYIKLPDKLTIKKGKIVFIDNLPYEEPYIITIEDINATVGMRLDDSYTKVLYMDTAGEGNLNGKKEQKLKWVISLNPTTPKLTMSNRFIVNNLDLLTFIPYIDRYSPFYIKRGYFSGTLVFDFDNGQIGSTNEVELSKLDFSIKPGYENATFWQTTVTELDQYLLSGRRTIIFDFKIKGEPGNLKFFVGPITKRALTMLVIDKVSQTILSPVKGEEGERELPQELRRVKDIIDIFKKITK